MSDSTAINPAATAELDREWVKPAAASLRHPLTRALLVLTLTTGLVDAVSYLGLGRVFTANMTGNIASRTVTSASAHRAASAAVRPATPPPTTITRMARARLSRPVRRSRRAGRRRRVPVCLAGRARPFPASAGPSICRGTRTRR